MDWQTLINIGGGAILTAIGWFCREIWDSVQKLKEDVKQIEIDLPSNYYNLTVDQRNFIDSLIHSCECIANQEVDEFNEYLEDYEV